MKLSITLASHTATTRPEVTELRRNTPGRLSITLAHSSTSHTVTTHPEKDPCGFRLHPELLEGCNVVRLRLQ